LELFEESLEIKGLMKLSVMVPTYRRPADLARCLQAIACQAYAADQVVAVVRTGDDQTIAIATQWQQRLPLEIVYVNVTGVVLAMNAGLQHCSGDVVAITDDDAAPRTDWLAKILAYFAADPKLGGLGGRDWIYQNGRLETGTSRNIGRILWYGRVVGNHHLGAGPAQEVDVLKGVNCAFRMAALRPIGFETRLLGEGAQVHWELCLCFALKRAGWRLIYDPEIAVDHFPAKRFDKDERNQFDAAANADQNFNFRLAISTGLTPLQRLRVLLWYYLIGSRDDPGVARLILMALKRDQASLSRHRAVQQLSLKKN
jgi:cellulose synthase/poly-beta-1,6-N-acetylglucosamine synthase-like glycosyltransferase